MLMTHDKPAVIKSKTQAIHDITITEKGDLTIELENIKELTIKYYLIDVEILFSRAPFVKDEAKNFSYVKPFETVNHKCLANQNQLISLPESLLNKNVVMEISSSNL